MSFKDQINKFVGKVRISDIENAFNFIIENVNAFIDTINNGSEFLEDTDNFYLGSTSIPAGNYTLTLGALKKILTAYDKEVIGGTVVKNPFNTDKAIVFPSLLIEKDNGISVIPQTTIDKPTQQQVEENPLIGKGIYIDPSDNSVTDNNLLQQGFYPSSIASDSNFSSEDDNVSYGNIVYYNDWHQVQSSSTAHQSSTYDTTYRAVIGCVPSSKMIKANYLSFYLYGTEENLDYGSVSIEYKDANNVSKNVYATLYPGDVNYSESGIITVTNRLDQGFKIEFEQVMYITKITFTVRLNTEVDPEGTFIKMDAQMDSGNMYSYNPAVIPTPNPELVTVADIDWNRDEWVMNTTDDWLYVNPEQSPLISLTVQNPPRGSAVNPDDTKPQFIVPRRYGTYAGERGDYNGGLVRLANSSNIIDNNYTNWSKSRNRAIDFVFAPVWVPQGMASTIFPVYGCSIAQYYTLS